MVVGHDEHMRARRQCAQDGIRNGGVLRLDFGRPRQNVGEARGIKLVGPAVHKVQLDRQPGKDPGQLMAHVTHAEDGNGGTCGKWLEENTDYSSAALLPVLGDGMFIERERQAFRDRAS